MQRGGQPGSLGDAATRLRRLYLQTYRLRVVGMGLGCVPVAVVLAERQAGFAAWAWVVAVGFAWPQLARARAARSADPYRAELDNFVVDSALAASLAPLMHFSLLPSVLLLAMTTADKISSGVRGLWRRTIVPMLGAGLVMAAFTRFAVDLHTSTATLLACLPVMVIHTLAVAASSHRLVRTVQAQNRQLEQLRRTDTLTGLGSRAHWQEMAGAMLAQVGSAQRASAQAASLLLVDVDHFKIINDRHGHSVGDDLLRGIADCIARAVPEGACAGRLGGDEFAVALSTSPEAAGLVAGAIHEGVRALCVAARPGLAVTVSIGIAPPPAPGCDLRAWLEAADRALYRAKAGGRDRTAFAGGSEGKQPNACVDPS